MDFLIKAYFCVSSRYPGAHCTGFIKWIQINILIIKIYSRITDQICCTRIKVSVSNIPANHQSIQNGIYDQINGTKYYASINKPQAIWYVEEYNNWAIGPLSKLGTKIRSITSTRYIHFIGEFPTLMHHLMFHQLCKNEYNINSWFIWIKNTNKVVGHTWLKNFKNILKIVFFLTI